MCMEYVNATVEACTVEETSPVSRSEAACEGRGTLRSRMDGKYLVPFQLMEVEVGENGRRILPGFRAIVRVNIMGSADGKSTSPVDTGTPLMFRLNLTHYTDEPKDRETVVVGMFEVVPEKEKLCQACVPFMNSIYSADIPQIPLAEGEGDYVLKLLVRKKRPNEQLEDFKESNEGFVIKSMTKLHFWTKEEIEAKKRKPDCLDSKGEVSVNVPGVSEPASV